MQQGRREGLSRCNKGEGKVCLDASGAKLVKVSFEFHPILIKSKKTTISAKALEMYTV